MPRDIPIIFSAPMVRAILADDKTMTRRMPWAWLRFNNGMGKLVRFTEASWRQAMTDRDEINMVWPEGRSAGKIAFRWTSASVHGLAARSIWYAEPIVQPGDRLWVREAVRAWSDDDGFDAVRYLADDASIRSTATTAAEAEKWGLLYRYGKKRGAGVPSIHMPRWASRLTLIVTAVKIERLQALTEADALAEGIRRLDRSAFIGGGPLYGVDESEGHDTAVGAFNHLWRSLHGDGSWANNPEVVALTFNVTKSNIDAPEARAA